MQPEDRRCRALDCIGGRKTMEDVSEHPGVGIRAVHWDVQDPSLDLGMGAILKLKPLWMQMKRAGLRTLHLAPSSGGNQKTCERQRTKHPLNPASASLSALRTEHARVLLELRNPRVPHLFSPSTNRCSGPPVFDLGPSLNADALLYPLAVIMTFDVAIVGGGIVGLATAYRLTERHPDASLVVLEKESEVAAHQSGHNSGVIHSGVFYEPGSLKAENCREGKRALIEFCERQGIEYEMCGKVVVATGEREVPELERIHEKGKQNQIDCTRIGPERLHELEPHVDGIAALHVPRAGIVDYATVTRALARCVKDRGHAVETNTEVQDLHVERTRATLATTAGDIRARHVINCAGLYADRIAEMSGQENLTTQIVPFRGEYYQLVPERRSFCSNLIYPVPDPAFPFLGVHYTPTIDGRVECGPSAVLAFAREGYLLSDVNPRELWEIVRYTGMQKLAVQHWRKGLRELFQSLSKRIYLRAARKLIPEVEMDDFTSPRAGVRAQALRPDGSLVDDFLIRETDRVVNVINAASPAATSALNIGSFIVDEYLTDRIASIQKRGIPS